MNSFDRADCTAQETLGKNNFGVKTIDPTSALSAPKYSLPRKGIFTVTWLRNRPVIGAIILTLLAMLIIVGAQYFGYPKTIGRTSWAEVITNLVIVLFAIAFISLNGCADSFRNFGTQVLSGLKSGWYVLVAAGIYFAIALATGPSATFPSWSVFIRYSLAIICVAGFEEIFFRGMVQNILQKHWSKPEEAKKVVLTGAIIFALMHYISLFSTHPKPVASTTQVIYVFFLAVCLGTVYYRTRDLAPVIILHFIFNFFGLISNLIHPLPEASDQDMSLLVAVITILPLLPGYFIGMRILKAKTEMHKEN